MRAFVFAMPPLLLGIAACSSADAPGARGAASGVDGQRSFALSGFDRVSLRGPDDVTIKAGPRFAVTATGDTALLDELNIVVEGGQLKVGRKGRGAFNWGGGDHDVRVTVTMPVINGASIAGSGDMSIDRVTGAFDANIAGSGEMDVKAITASTVKLEIAGAGEAEFAGTADDLSVSIQGSGSLDAKALRAKTLTVSVAGSGDVEATADVLAKVSVVGSGDVNVFGPARCETKETGSGNIRCNAPS